MCVFVTRAQGPLGGGCCARSTNCTQHTGVIVFRRNFASIGHHAGSTRHGDVIITLVPTCNTAGRFQLAGGRRCRPRTTSARIRRRQGHWGAHLLSRRNQRAARSHDPHPITTRAACCAPIRATSSTGQGFARGQHVSFQPWHIVCAHPVEIEVRHEARHAGRVQILVLPADTAELDLMTASR